MAKVTIESIRALQNNDGLTIRNGESISYKSGWQVADYGVECRTPEACLQAINDMNGNAGVWFADGVYYVDHSFRVGTKHEALAIGREHNQISVLGWKKMNLAYC